MKAKILAWLAVGMLVSGASWGFETRTGAVGCGRFFVSWDELSEGDFGRYEVYGGAGEAPAAAELEGEDPLMTIAGAGEAWRSFAHLEEMPAGARCWARVRRVDAKGKGEWGEAVQAVTLERGGKAGARATSYTKIPMFMYHHVMPRDSFPSGYDEGGWYSTANFERDLKYMKEHGMHTVTTSDIISGKLPKNPIMLTFDDGYKDFHQYAVPLLEKYGFTAVNALVTRMMGGQSTWAVPEWPLGRLMTWSEAKDCMKRGMEMGGHTQTHVNLYADASKMGQVAGCYNDLVNNVGKQIYFCYPWGMGGHNYEAGKKAARDAGFKFATRTYPAGIGHTGSDMFFFPRQFANQTDTLRTFLVKGGFDCDGDGLKDYEELDLGLNAAKKDTDGDGLTDYEEVKTYKTNGLKADTDGDGLTDGAEVKTYGSNPLKMDSDVDGLTDGNEVKKYKTKPGVWDTDGDGMSDGDEVSKYGTDPLVKNGRRPRNGVIAFPGRVEAENFDFGGEGLSFHDTTAGNAGDGKSFSDRVDVYSGGTKWAVGLTAAGEWLSYTVRVPTKGLWLLTLRTGANGSGGQMRVYFGGKDKTGLISVPNTGAWKTFQNVQTVVSLDAGQQVMGLGFPKAGSGGQAGWIDYIDAKRAYFGLPGTQREFGKGGANGKEFSVTGNVPWRATSSASWLTVTKGASGTGNGTVTYSVAANTGAARTGTIRVSAGGVSATYTVKQAGNGSSGGGSGSVGLSLTATSRIFGQAAVTGKELGVKASVSWKATSSASWLTISKGASGSGNGTVYYGVAANRGGRRTGRITVTGGGKTATFTVTQRAVLGLGSTSRSLGAAAASGKELAVGACVSWTAKSDASWLKIEKGASGSGNGKVYYGVTANTGAMRTGHITVTGGGISAKFTVTQAGVLSLSATSRTLGAAAASGKELGVLGSASWKASSDVAWLAITKGASGTGSGKVTYTVSANTGGTRTGHITVTGGGQTLKFTLTQTGKKSAAKSAARKPAANVWVTTSDGSDGSAVVDGDESTGWSPAGTDGAWVALTFGEERSVEAVDVVGDDLPDGMRALVSDDADHWSEEGGEGVHYLWVILPDEGAVPTVREITTVP